MLSFFGAMTKDFDVIKRDQRHLAFKTSRGLSPCEWHFFCNHLFRLFVLVSPSTTPLCGHYGYGETSAFLKTFKTFVLSSDSLLRRSWAFRDSSGDHTMTNILRNLVESKTSKPPPPIQPFWFSMEVIRAFHFNVRLPSWGVYFPCPNGAAYTILPLMLRLPAENTLPYSTTICTRLSSWNSVVPHPTMPPLGETSMTMVSGWLAHSDLQQYI